MFSDRTILITGGTGSFGRKFIEVLFEKHNPKKVIVYSRDELKQFEMQHSKKFELFKRKLRYFIGDIRDLPRLKLAMKNVDYVVHAAALKQVLACEYNPFEAVKTNIFGAQNVIDASIYCGVKKVMSLSTDKACAPINLYGATKLASDKLFIAANNYIGERDIRFSVVRYGNVMGSRGSVIPFFLEKKTDGYLPITDERMTRFNITLREGAEFVMMTLEKMWGGELFVPKIPSYNIMDLAKAIAPECEIKIVGIRAGEKLHEEMITVNDAIKTIEFKDYYVILPSMKDWDTEEFRLSSNERIGKYCEYGFSYNSGANDSFLTVDELKDLIAHKMHE